MLFSNALRVLGCRSRISDVPFLGASTSRLGFTDKDRQQPSQAVEEISALSMLTCRFSNWLAKPKSDREPLPEPTRRGVLGRSRARLSLPSVLKTGKSTVPTSSSPLAVIWNGTGKMPSLNAPMGSWETVYLWTCDPFLVET